MRLPAASHTARPWRIHALTPDPRDATSALEDVWALPTPRGPDDFPRPRGAVTPLYELPDEWAGELVKPGDARRAAPRLGSRRRGGHRAGGPGPARGRLGALYMAAIRPFRHRLVGPGLLRTIERRWREGASAPR